MFRKQIPTDSQAVFVKHDTSRGSFIMHKSRWFDDSPRGKGRVALVTGGGMHDGAEPGTPLGFGAAICLRLGLVDEYYVYVTDVDRPAAERTAEEISSCGGRAKALSLDVTDEAQIKEAIDKVASEKGRLDALCNNAGIFPIRPMDELTAEKFQRTVDVNLFGPTFVSKYGIQLMKSAGNGGVVTFIASDSGLKAAQICAVDYTETKAAVIKLAWQICREYQKEHGIRALAICPGPGNTPGLFRGWKEEDIERMKAAMFSGELIKGDEIAELVSLASDPKMRNWTLTTVNNSGGLAQY